MFWVIDLCWKESVLWCRMKTARQGSSRFRMRFVNVKRGLTMTQKSIKNQSSAYQEIRLVDQYHDEFCDDPLDEPIGGG